MLIFDVHQAKEAARKERQLGKLREQKQVKIFGLISQLLNVFQLMDQMNIDLTYAVSRVPVKDLKESSSLY